MFIGDDVVFLFVSSIQWIISDGDLEFDNQGYPYYPSFAVAPQSTVRPAGPSVRGRGVSTRSSGDSIIITDSITGPPPGTTFQYLTRGAFDTAGNLWISAGNSSLQGSVIEYTAAQQQKGGALAPAVAIGGLQAPEGIAFDKSGNLWVVDYQTDQLVEYTAAQIAASGSPHPTTAVSLAGVTFGGASYFPLALAFDKSGNVWISFSISFATRPPGVSVDSIPNYMVAQYAASAIATSGAPSPAIVLRPTGPGKNAYIVGYGGGLALDSAGNLWTANTATATVTEFAASSLVAGTNPAPAALLTGNWASNGGLVDISFGIFGALFVATGQELLVYGPTQITQSGSPTPAITYANTSGNPTTGIIATAHPAARSASSCAASS